MQTGSAGEVKCLVSVKLLVALLRVSPGLPCSANIIQSSATVEKGVSELETRA